jgi:hypothetical protein
MSEIEIKAVSTPEKKADRKRKRRRIKTCSMRPIYAANS